MAITYMVGDLVDLAANGTFSVVVHGANCKQTMNSGVAKALRDKWPQVYAADLAYSTAGNPLKLGRYSQAYVDCGTIKIAIINAYIQFDFGYDGARYVEYCAIHDVFSGLAAHYRSCAAQPVIGLPRIGCGRAGGKWDIVSGILDATMPDFDLRVVDLPQPEVWYNRVLAGGRS